MGCSKAYTEYDLIPNYLYALFENPINISFDGKNSSIYNTLKDIFGTNKMPDKYLFLVEENALDGRESRNDSNLYAIYWTHEESSFSHEENSILNNIKDIFSINKMTGEYLFCCQNHFQGGK